MAKTPAAFSRLSFGSSLGFNPHQEKALLLKAFVIADLKKRQVWSPKSSVVRFEENVNQFRGKKQSRHVLPSCLHISAFGCSGASPVVASKQTISAFMREDNMTEPILGDTGKEGFVWSALEIAEAVEGKIVKLGSPGSICTDSRTIRPGQWFLALVGPSFDGHDFLHHALARGCAGVVGNRVYQGWPRGFVQVEGNTLMALQKLGASARRKFKGPVVGITGSAGKTTTRVMTALALECLGHIHQTLGNQNNHIGVPLTLLSMPKFSKACVLEMGMNHMGEICELSGISEPSVRVILNVGPAHMENFRSLEEVAKAKGELLLGAKPGDICVMNADDPLLMSLPIPDGVQRVLFGSKKGCDLQLIAAETIQGGCAVRVILEHNSSLNVKYDQEGLQYKNSWDQITTSQRNVMAEESSVWISESSMSMGSDEGKSKRVTSGLNKFHGGAKSETLSSRVEFEIPSPGIHLAVNACAAAAVAVSLGIPIAKVGGSLKMFRPVSMRLNMEESKSGIKIINDVYNANPMSMVAALELLQSVDCKGKRVAVLGDMLELGISGKKAHVDALKMCQKTGIELVGITGSNFMEAIKLVDLASAEFSLISAQNSESLASLIKEKLNVGDVVLVKGSRAMQMEVVVDVIKGIHA